jgi:hypothetical protein
MPNVLACRVRHEHRTRLDTVTRSAPRPYLDGCVVDLCARVNFCAWAMCAGVTRVAISSRAPAAYSSFLRFRTAVSLTDTALALWFGNRCVLHREQMAIGGRGVVGLQ